MAGIQTEIQIVHYGTLAECFKACFGFGKPSDPITSIGEDGTIEIITRRSYMDTRRKAGCWGFTRYDKTEIHVWLSPTVRMERVVHLLAHELGHLRRPRYKNKNNEEKKAGMFAQVAETAYNMAVSLTKGNG